MKSCYSIIIVAILLILGNSLSTKAQNMEHNNTFNQIFPTGNELPEQFSQYFIGQAYLASLTKDSRLNAPLSNVTFEPGCRNNWHSHTGGQLLIVTAGRGYYQEQGQAARELHPGDIVEIAPDVIHWHGAAPDSWFSHLALECNPQMNRTTWLDPVDDEQYRSAVEMPNSVTLRLTESAVRNHDSWFPGYVSQTKQTDPELIEVFDNFAFDEILSHGDLDTKTRIMVTMASTIAQHTVGEYRMMLRAGLANGMSPVEIKEVLYHAVPYVGIAKVVDFIGVANDFLKQNGVKLPLPPQSTTTSQTRFEKGLAVQKEMVGEDIIDNMYRNSPADQMHIQRFLSANCFGDYQTRTGLDKQQRELLTFSMLVSLGGCESQVKGHIQANLHVGNDKKKLLDVITQLLPYIGYPRTLNAIACLNEMIPDNK